MSDGNAFSFGEIVLLLDMKPRRGQQHRYLVTLKEGGQFHSHNGYVAHEVIVGQPECVLVASTKNAQYRVIRPTLEDFVVEMPRGAQVIYPKDLATICMLADIGPGMKVFETGLGSGALSMTMLRYGAEITGYEIRDDFLSKARKNVQAFLGAGALDRYHTSLRDSYESVSPPSDGEMFDRAVLDLPEPWLVIPHLRDVVRPGGLVVAYTPSITQAVQVREAMHNPGWIGTRTMEVLHRGWYIEGQAVRPDHRMVAHTAFLTVGRVLADEVRNLAGVASESAVLAVANAALDAESGDESDAVEEGFEPPAPLD